MKKLILLHTLLFFLVSYSYAQDEYRVTTNSSLNARSSNSANASVLGTFNNGDIINVYSSQGGWARTSYNGKTAYVSSNYIIFVRSASQRAAQKAEADIPWYNPMGWGIVGWLLRWVAMPFVVFGIGIAFPIMFLGEIRFLNNFFCGLLAIFVAYWLLIFYIFLLQLFDVYNGSSETTVLWIMGILLGIGSITQMINSRCPNCHYNNSNIVDSFINRREYKTTTKYSDGSRDVSYHTKSDTHNKHQCPECGYLWWIKE